MGVVLRMSIHVVSWFTIEYANSYQVDMTKVLISLNANRRCIIAETESVTIQNIDKWEHC